jgi:hypothetical protein
VAGGMLTDLYELNMAASYLRRGMMGQATFSLFGRRLPKGRGFLIAAGLEDCLAFLESPSFTRDDLAGRPCAQDPRAASGPHLPGPGSAAAGTGAGTAAARGRGTWREP